MRSLNLTRLILGTSLIAAVVMASTTTLTDDNLYQNSSLIEKRLLSFATLSLHRKVHGIIMSTCFVILFPLFALTLTLIPYSKTATRIHAPLQLITLALSLAGFGLGISLERAFHLTRQHHPRIGTVVMVYLIVFQPLLGYLHHRCFVRSAGGKSFSVFGYVHRWVGRSVLILGIVNGGLGLRLARLGAGDQGATRKVEVAYGVVAGVAGVFYILVVLVGGRIRLRLKGAGSEKGVAAASP